MAVDLGPNTKYELLSEDHLCEDKVIVHVKLTDSCLRALQGFKNIKGSSKKTPLIKFTGQNGRIAIPTNGDDSQQFMFNCSTLQSKDSQGCLDCIQQSGHSRAVVSYGSINHKINVLGTDDSYKMTQDRMKVAEEQRQEVRTKVINTPGKAAKKSRHIERQTKILNSVKRNSKLPSNIVKVSNGASKSLRDRVIHLLAIRPFKKPELIDRLSKEGVRLDKNALTRILQQVTSLDQNKYNLHRHIYSEIKVDSWPYSNNEKQIVQKRITNSQEDTSKNNLQRNADTNGDQHIPTMNKKRPSEPSTYTDPVNKKQRIARVINNNVTNESQKDRTKHKDVSMKKIGDKQEKTTPYTTMENATSDSHLDYKKKYRTITSYEQRLQYRRDFEVEFKEYENLQSEINAVTKQFEELKGKLEKCPQHSSKEKEVIEKQVVALYQKQQQDPTWERNKKRCRHLHSKLAYIKELIKDYDSKRHAT